MLQGNNNLQRERDHSIDISGRYIYDKDATNRFKDDTGFLFILGILVSYLLSTALWGKPSQNHCSTVPGDTAHILRYFLSCNLLKMCPPDRAAGDRTRSLKIKDDDEQMNKKLENKDIEESKETKLTAKRPRRADIPLQGIGRPGRLGPTSTKEARSTLTRRSREAWRTAQDKVRRHGSWNKNLS